MKLKTICHWGMYNWAVTPVLLAWRNRDGSAGVSLHWLRGRVGLALDVDERWEDA